MFHRALSLGKSIEQIQIEKALITPYEKTIKILKKVVNYLGDKNPLAEEVRWVIDIIIGQKLYYYEGLNKLQDYEESKDLKLVLGILNEYSEGDVFSRNIYKKPQTVQFKSDNLSGYRDMLKNYKSEILSESSSNEEEDKDVSEEKDKINFNSDKESDNDDKKKSEKKKYKHKKIFKIGYP